MEERLHKILAEAGVGSRRKCEELIQEGKITVDGEVVKKLGLQIDATRHRICYTGKVIKPERKFYFILNKPRRYISANYDPDRRRLVVDLFRNIPCRLYTVGRLDADSEGLVIVTNDGELCNLLTHPRYGVTKTYQVVVRGYIEQEALEKARKGIWLSEGKTAPASLRLIKRSRNLSIVEITLKEGKKREVRRIFARLGHPVTRLCRIRIGKLYLAGLKTGEYREVSKEMIQKLCLQTEN